MSVILHEPRTTCVSMTYHRRPLAITLTESWLANYTKSTDVWSSKKVKRLFLLHRDLNIAEEVLILYDHRVNLPVHRIRVGIN